MEPPGVLKNRYEVQWPNRKLTRLLATFLKNGGPVVGRLSTSKTMHKDMGATILLLKCLLGNMADAHGDAYTGCGWGHYSRLMGLMRS